jgi:hypothetical protein
MVLCFAFGNRFSVSFIPDQTKDLVPFSKD